MFFFIPGEITSGEKVNSPFEFMVARSKEKYRGEQGGIRDGAAFWGVAKTAIDGNKTEENDFKNVYNKM